MRAHAGRRFGAPAGRRAGPACDAGVSMVMPTLGPAGQRRTGPRPALAAALVAATLGLAACGHRPAPRSGPVATVSRTARQRIAGFGASGAWWPQDLIQFPIAAQRRVARLLFTTAGADLSVYRYNIGGGGVGVTVPQHAPQDFLTGSGRYDWTRDAAGQRFLGLAHSDRVPVLIGFVNSAPPLWKTPNGRTGRAASCGGSLIAQDIPAYAAYLTAVARHFHQEGITLRAISPMNEPDYSRNGCSQEGMRVPVAERAALVATLAGDLRRQAPYSGVIADESSQVRTQLIPEASAWLPKVGGDLLAIAFHTYDFPLPPELEQLAALSHAVGVPTWMTEICCWDGQGFGPQYDPTMTGGLWLAEQIWQDLRFGQDSSFQWWVALSSAMGCDPAAEPACATAVNPRGWNDGLIYYDPYFATNHDYRLYPTKRLWVLGNFSRFVRPGAIVHVVHGAPAGVEALAFQASGGGWVVVAIVTGAHATRLSVALPPGRRLSHAAAWRTDPSLDLAPVGAPTVAGRTVTGTLPPQSVTTWVLQAAWW